jgi:magnesium and cobalt transporter
LGGTAGLITLEDVLEEIVGEIRDEHDEEARLFLRRGEHEAIVSGQLTVEDFNDYFGAELPTEGAGTMGGLLTEELGHIPKRDDTAAFGPITLRVLRADSRRVLSLRATRETPSEAD